MANEKILNEKKQIVVDLTEKIKGATSGVFVQYTGISVAADTALRSELRKNDVEYAVVKNTLTKRAVKEAGYEGLDDVFNGAAELGELHNAHRAIGRSQQERHGGDGDAAVGATMTL